MAVMKFNFILDGVGKLSEIISGVEIGPSLLEAAPLLAVKPSNPLEPVFYISAIVFLLSLFLFAPLRAISNWEVRRYSTVVASTEAELSKNLQPNPSIILQHDNRIAVPVCVISNLGTSSADDGLATEGNTETSDLLINAQERSHHLQLQQHSVFCSEGPELKTVASNLDEAYDMVVEELLPIKKLSSVSWVSQFEIKIHYHALILSHTTDNMFVLNSVCDSFYLRN